MLCHNFVIEYLLQISVTQFLLQIDNFCVIDTNGYFSIEVVEGALPRAEAVRHRGRDLTSRAEAKHNLT